MPGRRRYTVAPRARGSANVSWVRSVFGAITIAGPSTKAVIGTVVPSTDFDETVRRTRAQLWIKSDQAAVVEDQIGAFGMFIANDAAVTAGAASLLGPVTDASDDAWFVWQPVQQTTPFPPGASPLGFHYEIDSKAMRKLVQGQQIVMMYETGLSSLGTVIRLGFSILTSFKR